MKKLNYTDMLAYLGISSAHPGGSRLTKKITAAEKISSEMNVLDIGCGTGQTAAFLAKKYKCNVTALDAHSTMVEKARKRFAREKVAINVLKGNAEKLSLADESFDYIFAESVVVFTDPIYSLPEFKRVLKQGGRLIAIEMVAKETLTLTEKKEIQNFYGVKNVFSIDEWKTHFLNADFSQVLTDDDDQVINKNHPVIEENDPSNFIDPDLFKIFVSHGEMLQRYKEKLGYRVFRSQK
ncbi:class I SAM-dependent methyltransferase [Bacillaceae bacterium IKA-2]|nr:class I SAM-dependent methyltransferase [Bacillaceae bacterium IKA-2]